MTFSPVVSSLTLTLLLVSFGACLPHPARAEAPSIRLLSSSATLTEASTGDQYVRIFPGQPAKFLLTGPGRLQADFRVNLATVNGRIPDGSFQLVTVDVLASGKLVGRFRIQPKPGEQSWKDETGLQPSAPTGLYLDLSDGSRPYEIRVDGGAPKGVSLRLVEIGKARASLPASAAVVPYQPAIQAVASAAPAAPLAFQVPIGIDQLGADVPRSADARLALARTSALGAGVDVRRDAGAGAEAFPFLSYRFWMTDRAGLGARLGMITRSGETVVSSAPDGSPGTGTQVASGHGYDMDFLLDGSFNVHRAPHAALFVLAGAGSVYRKEIRADPEMGLLARSGIGIELSPASIPNLGLTLESGLRLESFQSTGRGSSLQPTVSVTFNYYLNRSSGGSR